MACVPEHVVPGEAALNTLAQLRACEALGLSCASSANPPRDGAEPHTNPEQIPRYLLVCGYPAAPTPPQQERTVVHVFEIRQWDMRGGTHSPAQDTLAALLSEPAPKKIVQDFKALSDALRSHLGVQLADCTDVIALGRQAGFVPNLKSHIYHWWLVPRALEALSGERAPHGAEWTALAKQMRNQANWATRTAKAGQVSSSHAELAALLAANMRPLLALLQMASSMTGETAQYATAGDVTTPTNVAAQPDADRLHPAASQDAGEAAGAVQPGKTAIAAPGSGLAEGSAELAQASVQSADESAGHAAREDAGEGADRGEQLANATRAVHTSPVATPEPDAPPAHEVDVYAPDELESAGGAESAGAAHSETPSQQVHRQPVTAEAAELFDLLGVLQLLPAASRDEAAAALGYGACVDMLQRMFVLRRGFAAGEAADAAPPDSAPLVEIVLDDGRPVLLRRADGSEAALDTPVDSAVVVAALARLRELQANSGDDAAARPAMLPLLQRGATPATAAAAATAATVFQSRTRVGIPGTLHRVASVLDYEGAVVGLTIRVGRHQHGTVWPLADLLQRVAAEMMPLARGPSSASAEARLRATRATGVLQDLSPSVLLLGGPGTGKTTALRDVASELSDTFGLGRQCVVVDGSMEIGGFGQLPHEAIGSARRMAVPADKPQGDVMLDALTNHTPRAIVVDELSHAADVRAARSICQRGIALVATAHAPSLAAMLSNPDLSILVGGVNSVTLSDSHARERHVEPEARYGGGTFMSWELAKSRSERRGPSMFRVVVELLGTQAWRIHWDAAASVDALLAGRQPPAEVRMVEDGEVHSRWEGQRPRG